MESWVVGYEGDDDVERHAGVSEPGAATPTLQSLRLRVISDYI